MNLKKIAFLVTALLPFTLVAQPSQPQIKVTPVTNQPAGRPNMPFRPSMMPPKAQMPEKGKLSYAIGMYFGGSITNAVVRGSLDVDYDAVLAALKDVVNGKPTKMTERDMHEVLNQLRAAMAAKRQESEGAARHASEAFLTQYGKGPGVTVLPNGLEYKVLKKGTGPLVKENDTVTVAYRGTFSSGAEFDHNDNFTTPVHGRIIQGWQKILPLMNVGSKFQVVIPPALGYGPRGYPPKIPGDAVLVFDLEVKSDIPGGPAPASPAPPPSAARTPANPTVQVSGEIIKVPSQDELKKGAKIEVIKAGQTNAAVTNTAAAH